MTAERIRKGFSILEATFYTAQEVILRNLGKQKEGKNKHFLLVVS